MSDCKISYFGKYHNQVLYERMRKFSQMAHLFVDIATAMVAALQNLP
jgi:hypothetical protein